MLPINQKSALRVRQFSILLLMLILANVNRAVKAQQNGIISPTSGETLTGIVEVTGTAVHPDYLRYELAFLYEANAAAGWIVFAEGGQPVQNGRLAVWDTTVGRDVGAPVFPDGRYQLRLRVVRTDYNYDEYFVTGLMIFNSGPTPEPTPDETAVALTVTAQSVEANPQTTGSENGFQQPTPLPSLTPFPTPTAQATAVTNQADRNASPPEYDPGGVLGQLQEVDTTRFSQAFLGGVKTAFTIFLLFALYLLIRRLGRQLWRAFLTRKNS